jgi:hypothetical protein
LILLFFSSYGAPALLNSPRINIGARTRYRAPIALLKASEANFPSTNIVDAVNPEAKLAPDPRINMPFSTKPSKNQRRR